jgi:tetratricopeptide (TPR) repeat protein
MADKLLHRAVVRNSRRRPLSRDGWRCYRGRIASMTTSQCPTRAGAYAALALLLTTTIPPAAAQTAGPPPPPPETPAVAASDTASAPYVIESLVVRYRFERDGTGTEEQAIRVKVQSTPGLQAWGQLGFLFTPASQSMALALLEVHKPDGSVIKAGESAITEAAAQPDAAAAMFKDLRQMMITVPSLAVGDTLVARLVKTVHTPTIPGQILIEHEFTSSGVVIEERLEIDLPASMTPIVRVVAAAPKESSGLQGTVADGRRRYVWTGRNPIAKEPEPIDPDDEASEAARADVRLSTFRDWDGLATWYRGLATPAVVVDETIRAKARELTAMATTEDARIQALYDFVSRDIRYVSLSFGLGRFSPHPAPEVLANRYGDCKDKHTLLAALLQAIGIEAWPALANYGRRVDREMPSPAEFNHLLTVIPRGASAADWIWLDTTPGVTPYRMLIDPLRGRDVLLVAPAAAPVGRRAGLVRTPVDTPFARYARVDVDVELDALGILRGTLRQALRGDVEAFVRGQLIAVPSEQYPEFAKGIATVAGLGKDVTDVRIEHLDTTREPLAASFRTRYGGAFTWTATGATLTIPAGGMSFANDTLDAWTKRPRLQLASPYSSTWKLRVRLPEGYRPTLPVPVSAIRDEVEYVSSYRLDGRDLYVERVFRMKGREILAARASDYLSFIAAVRADEAQTIELAFDGAAIPQIPTDATAAELYRAGYAMYQQRRDQQAVTLGLAAVKVDPKHGSAWDLLGLSYQRMGRLDAAIDVLRTQVNVQPTHDRAHAHLASALREARRNDEARAAFEKHLEIAPTDGQAFLDLGVLLLEADRYAEAAPRLERAVALKGTDAWSHARLGAAHAALGDAAKARTDFETAVRLSATPPIWTYAGWHLAQRGLETTWADELARKTLTAAAEKMGAITVDAAGVAERDLLQRIGWSWATVGLLQIRAGRVEQAERYLTAAQLVLNDPIVTRHLDGVRTHLSRQTPAWTWEPFWRAIGDGPRTAGRARLTLLIGPGGHILAGRFAQGDERWRALVPRVTGAPLPIVLPDGGFTRLPIELDVDCTVAKADCRAEVALRPWK